MQRRPPPIGSAGHNSIETRISTVMTGLETPIQTRRRSRRAAEQIDRPSLALARTRFASAPTTRNGGDRARTDDPLLAKQVLSQLSYTPTPAPTAGTGPLVGQGGFEPPTPRLSSVCSNQLSY